MKRNGFKKILALFLTAAVMLTLSVPAMAARSFPDVKVSKWSYRAVEYCYAKGYMSGEGNGKFSPDGKVSRAMVVQVLWNKSGKPASADSTPFTDVGTNKWFYNAVAWAKASNVVSGTSETQFSPGKSVTRQDVCTIVYRYYCKGLDNGGMERDPELASESEMGRFSDYQNVNGYAREAVRWAVKSKFMAGSSGALNPRGTATRQELAQFLMNLDGILGEDTESFKAPADDEPETPAPSGDFTAPVKFQKTAGGVSVSGLEFDPRNGYSVQAVLANDKLYSTEGAANIAKRKNAYVAVNGAFYSSYSNGDLTTYSTLISGGKLLRLDNHSAPYKPAFVVDSTGKASIQFFKVVQKLTCTRDGAEIGSYKEVGCNLRVPQNDATKMICTRVYGNKVEGKVAGAAVVDENGIITKVYQNASDVPVPASGYLLYHRKEASQWATLLSKCQVGDKVEITTTYEGSSTQDIVTSLSCGPTLVKNGKVYGNTSTYRQEGFTDSHVLDGASARMAIGVKADGTVVIAHAFCTLSQLSSAMLALGCQNAMNLDGGASCALYLQGNALVPAGRAMSNMLVFTKN